MKTLFITLTLLLSLNLYADESSGLGAQADQPCPAPDDSTSREQVKSGTAQTSAEPDNSGGDAGQSAD